MKAVAAEIQPAIDIARIQKEAHRAWVAVQDAERKEEKTAEQAQAARNEAGQKRLELGRVLCEARKTWPARGPRARGWGEFLSDIGIPEQTARDYMRLAGYVEKISTTDGDVVEIPTYAEAGIKKSPIQIVEHEAPPPRRNEPWYEELERLAESLERHTKAAFSAAERIDAICAEHSASFGSASLALARSMLAGVRAVSADALKLMGEKQ